MELKKEKNKTKIIMYVVVAIIFILQLCVPFFIIISNASADLEGRTEIIFNDKNMLRAVMYNLEDIEIVRKGLKLYVLPEDISNIRTLNLSGWNISNIDGIEAFTSLNELDLSENHIKDISKIPQNVTNLDVKNQNITIHLLEYLDESKIVDLPQIFNDERVKQDSTFVGTYNNEQDNGNKQIELKAENFGNNTTQANIEGGIADGTTCTINYIVSNIITKTTKTPSTITGNGVEIVINIKGKDGINEIKFLEGGNKSKEDFENEINILQTPQRECEYKYIRENNGTDSIYIKDISGKEKILEIEINNIVAYITYNENRTVVTLNFINDGNTYTITNNEENCEHEFTDSETYFEFEFKKDGTEETGTALAEKNSIEIIIKDPNMYIALKEELINHKIAYMDLGYNQIDEQYKIIMSETSRNEVEELDLNNKNITNLCGLEKFVNLKSINLSDNMLSQDNLNFYLFCLNNLENITLVNVCNNLEINGENFIYTNLKNLNVQGCSATVKNINKGFNLVGGKILQQLGSEGNNITRTSVNFQLSNVTNCFITGDISDFGENIVIDNVTINGNIDIDCYNITNCTINGANINGNINIKTLFYNAEEDIELKEINCNEFVLINNNRGDYKDILIEKVTSKSMKVSMYQHTTTLRNCIITEGNLELDNCTADNCTVKKGNIIGRECEKFHNSR